MRFSTLLTAAVVAALTTTTMVAPAQSASGPRSEYLITTTAAGPRTVSELSTRIAAAGGRVTERFDRVRIVLAELPERAAAALAARPDVIVEKNGVVELFATQSSPPSWGLDRIDQPALPLSRSYTYPDTETGSGVDAYIVDTGILLDHEQFAGRTQPGFNATTDGLDANDCANQGHGTHVAGTTGGSTVGVARGTTLIPVRVFTCSSSSGSWSDVVRGLDWIVAHHGARPAVANLSLGGGPNSTVDAAVQRVIDDGVTVVVAAGNSNADACAYTPARVVNAITVASSTALDARAGYSNYGTCVDIFAPGGDANGYIYSAYAKSPTSYASLQGTSMASPHVAGVAARYLQQNPTAAPSAVATAIIGGSVQGVITSPGTGTVNRLLHADPSGFAPATQSTPSAPTSLAVTAGLGSLSYSWAAPVSDGGSPVTSYTATVRDSTGSAVSTSTVSASTFSATTSGLASGSSYTVSLTATNALGTSPATTSTATQVLGSATAPRNVTVSSPARLKTKVAWTAPSSLGGSTLVRYEVRWTSTSSTSTYGTWTSAGTATSYTISGIAKGEVRYVQVRAVTAVGPGTATSDVRFTQSK